MRFFIALFLLSSCSSRQTIPDDFMFHAEYSAVQPGAGGRYAVIARKSDSTSNFIITTVRDSTTRHITRSRDEMNVLYQEVMRKRVFRLKDSYANMATLDGETTTLQIRANGKFKEIRMRNFVPAELESVFKVLNELTSKER